MHHSNKASRNFFLAFRRWTIVNAIPAHHHSTSTAVHHTAPAALEAAHNSTARRQSRFNSQHTKERPKVRPDSVQQWMKIRVPSATDRKLLLHLIEETKLNKIGIHCENGQDILLGSRKAEWLQEAFDIYRRAFQLYTGIPDDAVHLHMKRLDREESETIRLHDDHSISNVEAAERSSIQVNHKQKLPLFVWVPPNLGRRLYHSRSLWAPGSHNRTSGYFRNGVKVDYPVKDQPNFMCVWATDISSIIDALNLRIVKQINTPERYRQVRFVDQHVACRSRPYTKQDYEEMASEFLNSHVHKDKPVLSEEESSTVDGVTVDIIDSGLRNRDAKSVEDSDKIVAMGIFEADPFAVATQDSTEFDQFRLQVLTTEKVMDATANPVVTQAGPVSQSPEDLEPTATVAVDGSADIQAAEPAPQHDLRAMLSRMTNSVVLITTCDTEGSGSERFRGVTVSSFAAVTMEPEPFISFNIRVPSRTYTAFERSGEVFVHILAGSRPAATIADTFTRPYDDASEPFELLSKAGANVIVADGSPPRIDFRDGVIAWLRCGDFSTNASYTVGDHRICVFAVKQVITAQDLPREYLGLAYAGKRYRRVRPIRNSSSLVQQSSHPDSQKVNSTSRPDTTTKARSINRYIELKREKLEHQPSRENEITSTALDSKVIDNSANATTDQFEQVNGNVIDDTANVMTNRSEQMSEKVIVDAVEREKGEVRATSFQNEVMHSRSGVEGQKKHEKRAFPPLDVVDQQRIDGVKQDANLTDAARIFLSNLERDLYIDMNESLEEADNVEYDKARSGKERLAIRNIEKQRRSLLEEAASAGSDDLESDTLSSADQYVESEAIVSENVQSDRLAARQADRERRLLLDQAAGALNDDHIHDRSLSNQVQYVPSEGAVEAQSIPAKRLAERQADKERRSLFDQAASIGFDDPAHDISSFYSLQNGSSNAAVEAESMPTVQLPKRRSLLDEAATISSDDPAHDLSSSNPPQDVSSAAAAESESGETDQSTKQETHQEQQNLSNQKATSLFVDSASKTTSSTPVQDKRTSAVAAAHARMPTTLALVPKVTADQFRANSVQPAQQVSPLHTTSFAWRPSYARPYSSASATLSRFSDDTTPTNHEKSFQEDATTDSETFPQYDPSTPSDKNGSDDIDEMSAPDLSITVNDFLCHSFVKYGKRNSRLYNTRTVTHKAEARLKQEMADGTLTPELSEKLESLIASNERYIAWTLAERAAFDLAEMLDQGRIVHSRISFIEGCIEKGQQAIYEEAQAIMTALEKKSVTIDWYEKRQQLLVKTEAVLRDELVRLRAFHEDDDRDDW